MARPFPITTTQIVGLFVESLLYGVYLVNFGFCLHALLRTNSRWRRREEIRWVMLTISLFFLVNNTLSAAVQLWRCINAFIENSDDPTRPLSRASQWDNVLKIATILGITLVCDAVLIYRSFIVYARKIWVIIPSTTLWIGDAVCCVRAIQLQSQVDGPATVNTTQVNLYLKIFWALTLAINLFTTSMIVFRLWKVDRRTRNHRYASGGLSQRTKLQSVMRVVFESGILYTVTAFIVFILTVAQSNGVYIAVNAERLIASIAFDLIIIATANRNEKEYATTSHTSSAHPRTALPLSIIRGGNEPAFIDEEPRNTTLQIKVTQEVDLRHDDGHDIHKFHAV